jgi:hypothetical protein
VVPRWKPIWPGTACPSPEPSASATPPEANNPAAVPLNRRSAVSRIDDSLRKIMNTAAPDRRGRRSGDPLWNEVNPLLFWFQTTNKARTQQVIRRFPLRHTGAGLVPVEPRLNTTTRFGTQLSP